MAITVSWGYTGFGTIFVPRADMPIVTPSPEVRSIDVNKLRGDVMSLAASVAGGPIVTPFDHSGERTISGTVYARSIIFFYTIEFEDGAYQVRPFGANHNIADVMVVNNVSVVPLNSAGLIRAELDQVAADVAKARKALLNRMEIDFVAQTVTFYEDDGTTPMQVNPIETDAGENVRTGSGIQTKRKAPLP